LLKHIKGKEKKAPSGENCIFRAKNTLVFLGFIKLILRTGSFFMPLAAPERYSS
jgi:hypothetical protein